MRAVHLAALLVAPLTACDQRVFYTVEGTVTSSADGAPIEGIRVECAIVDDDDSAGEGVSDDAGGYSCSAVLDATGTGRGPRTLLVTFVDEDDAQNGAFRTATEEVAVDPDATESLDLELDPD